MNHLNETHDASLASWVASANNPDCDFPIQNLPHGVFRRRGQDESFRGGIAIGEQILDMRKACASGVFDGPAHAAALNAAGSTLNALMDMESASWRALRLAVSRALRKGASGELILRDCLIDQIDVEFALPARIGDYTDFFASQFHAMNVNQIFAPGTGLYPQFKWLPIAYHGRASSIEVSGASFHRPLGQRRPVGDAPPSFGPSAAVDYELELAAFIGRGNERGMPIAIDKAEEHVFGVCLLNDWSARDVQGWEAQPLGPFLAKNFLSTISPWIITLEALAPFRSALQRQPNDPPTLPYLASRSDAAEAGLDIQLETWLYPDEPGGQGTCLSRTSSKHTYWSLAQMVTHHTVGGCNLRPGDLIGTGTQSGPTSGEEGCLLELSKGGREAIQLANGATRRYLEDGDTIVLRGLCKRDGYRSIGMGECRGQVIASLIAQD